jgi:cytosine/adenosine deaminase-related metal-dependent hydrolase
VRALLAARQTIASDGPGVVSSARRAIDAARASGTGLVGDVTNTLVTPALLRAAGMPARVFHELLGFRSVGADRQVRAARAAVAQAAGESNEVRISLAPHAPYSVSPALFAAIRGDLAAHAGDVSSVHLCESPEEAEFIERGTGACRDLLSTLGAWDDEWRPTGGSPVTYLADLGVLDARMLAVHAVQCTGADLACLRSLGTTIVSCPRSNRHVGVGDPPLEAFYASGVPVALGTDSLASVADLDMFAELAAARAIAPRVPAGTLLASATREGARALGFGDSLGTLEAGKRASVVAVALPPRVGDVEEYLLSGIATANISWLNA